MFLCKPMQMGLLHFEFPVLSHTASEMCLIKHAFAHHTTAQAAVISPLTPRQKPKFLFDFHVPFLLHLPQCSCPTLWVTSNCSPSLDAILQAQTQPRCQLLCEAFHSSCSPTATAFYWPLVPSRHVIYGDFVDMSSCLPFPEPVPPFSAWHPLPTTPVSVHSTDLVNVD